MRKLYNILILAIAWPMFSGVAASRPPLFGLLLIVDPGHGGNDVGASGYFSDSRIRVVEDEYVYDIGLRLLKKSKENGAIAIPTILDPLQKKSIENEPRNVISPDGNEIYFMDKKPVRAGRNGLTPRVLVANYYRDHYPKHCPVFISLHFDHTGNSELSGVYLVAPSDVDAKIVGFLETEFRNAKRLRSLRDAEYHPIVQSGDRNHGMRRIMVLNPKVNEVKERVLIELGNFTNPQDVWRIRDPKVREAYAEIMTRALIRFKIETPLSKCR